jgi:hypothetical protein
MDIWTNVWCAQTLTLAVELFHQARVHPDNEAEELSTLAVGCANSAFQARAHLIMGEKDATAKAYGQVCYDRFRDEIQSVVTEPEVEEMIQ